MIDHHDNLIVCGSVGSFLVREVIRSKALYGRINLEINLGPLPMPELCRVFQPERSLHEVAELYMAVGGVPQYLEMVDPKRSVQANLCDLCFSPEGYLVHEFDRIFASHFGSNQHYRRVPRWSARSNGDIVERVIHATATARNEANSCFATDAHSLKENCHARSASHAF